MFEIQDKNKRKWQCFVCGVLFTDPEEYRQHIKENHEEGREFITCPACGYPIRDLPAHFKAKHPKRTMPKNMQTKVSIWHDFTPQGKKKKTNKPRFRKGYFQSTKNNKDILYRSGYECEVYECLEADRDIRGFKAEPFKVEYFYKGKWRKYIPDLLVEFYDGKKEVWEIKPKTQTTYEQNKAKWTAMNNYANNLGWHFEVKTEVGIEKLKKKIREQNS